MKHTSLLLCLYCYIIINVMIITIVVINDGGITGFCCGSNGFGDGGSVFGGSSGGVVSISVIF